MSIRVGILLLLILPLLFPEVGVISAITNVFNLLITFYPYSHKSLFLSLNTKAYMNGTVRAKIKKGQLVKIILKKDQRTDVLTEGIVKDLLTSAPVHHRGIKVRLEDGQIGRVQEIIEE